MSVKCVLLPSKERGGGVELVDVTDKRLLQPESGSFKVQLS